MKIYILKRGEKGHFLCSTSERAARLHGAAPRAHGPALPRQRAAIRGRGAEGAAVMVFPADVVPVLKGPNLDFQAQLRDVVSYQFITRRHSGKPRKNIYFKMCAEKIYAGGEGGGEQGWAPSVLLRSQNGTVRVVNKWFPENRSLLFLFPAESLFEVPGFLNVK